MRLHSRRRIHNILLTRDVADMSRCESDKDHRRSGPIGAASMLTRLSIVLAASATISLAVFVHAVSSELRSLVPLTAALSLVLVTGCSLCLTLALVTYLRARRRSAPPVAHINTHADYVAEYSWGDRMAVVSFTILCGGLLCLLLILGAHFRSMAISAVLFCAVAYSALEVTGTRVRFTDRA
jgi:hypothetical protein